MTRPISRVEQAPDRPIAAWPRPSRLRTGSLGFLLPALLLAAGCNGGKEATGDAAAAAETNQPIPVAVTVLERGSAEAVVRAWATVHPAREAALVAGITGRVDAVHVGLGDRVRRGAPLLEVDAALHAAALVEAEADVKSATVAREKAAKDLERAEALFEAGTISDTEIEASRAADAAAAAVLASRRTARERARKAESDARLTAPFDGWIATRPPDPGTTVGLGTELTRVVDLARVRLRAELSEADLAHVTLGAPCRVAVESLPERAFPGTVTGIGPQADLDSRQFPVEIEVQNPDDLPLRAGMIARVEIVYRVYRNVPLVPVDALIQDHARTGFFVVTAGAAHWREAELGPRRDGRAALLAGGASGDSVVVLGQTRLADGAPVRVETAP